MINLDSLLGVTLVTMVVTIPTGPVMGPGFRLNLELWVDKLLELWHAGTRESFYKRNLVIYNVLTPCGNLRDKRDRD